MLDGSGTGEGTAGGVSVPSGGRLGGGKVTVAGGVVKEKPPVGMPGKRKDEGAPADPLNP